jgi:hypothetical protein
MIRLRNLALVVTLSVVGASTFLWAQDKPATTSEGDPTCPPKKQGRAAFPVNRDKGEPLCSPDKNTFNHSLHMKPTDANKAALSMKNDKGEPAPMRCSSCHSYVNEENAARGEKKGDIRRPGHKTCLTCHGIEAQKQKMSNGKPVPSFYDKDPKTRTICANCHGDALGPDNKPIVGSYNDMTKPLKAVGYGIASDAPPCDVQFGFDFSHASHAEQSCADCHGTGVADCKEYKKDDKGNIIRDDFGNPKECVDEKSATICDKQTLASPSHPQCWACHDAKSTKGRDGGKDPFAKAGADRCESCHTAKEPPEGGKAADYFTAPYSKSRNSWAHSFTHKNHMAFLDKNAPSVDAGAKCRVCHKSQIEATSLNDTGKTMSKDIYQKNMCFCCHDGNPAFSGTDIMNMSGTCYRCHISSGLGPQPGDSHNCKDSRGFNDAVKVYLGLDALKKIK